MAGRSGRNWDPVRVVAAQISGTAERSIVGHGLTEDHALVEIGACLGPLSTMERQEALTHACSRYVGETTDPAVAITEMLRRAGADVERARAIHAQRGGGFVIR